MFRSATVALALVALTSATPVALDTGIRIPLHKRTGPTPLTSAEGVANVNKMAGLRAGVAAKYATTLGNYLANTGQMHPSATDPTSSALVKRQKGALLDDNQNELWSGTVSIGTPAQNFLIDLDTGSSDLWVFGLSVSGHNKYTASRSSTASKQSGSFSISYGDGSTAFGPIYKDTVAVAGLKATKQSFSPVTSQSGFDSSAVDGILGMAYQSISSLSASPYFNTLFSERVVANNYFSFKLATSGSELYLGGADSSQYTGAITYTSVTSQSAPVSEAAALYANIPGASLDSASGYYFVPCSTLNAVSVSFSFAGSATKWAVPGSYLNLGQISSGSSTCYSGLIGQDLGIAGWIVGDVFLRAVYTVFNFGTNQVGFAKLA